MELLPTQLLPAVQYVRFGIFDLAIPNIMAWGLVIGILLLAFWIRIPAIFESRESKEEEKKP